MRTAIAAVLASGLLTVAASAWSADAAPAVAPAPDSAAKDAGPPEESGVGIDYRVEFEGATAGPLGDLLEQSSLLVTLRDRKPATVAALERRAVGDLRRLAAVLRSDGYYDSEIDYRIDTTVVPVTVTIIIARGDPYKLTSFEIRYIDRESVENLPRDPHALGIELNRRVRAADVIAAELRMEEILGERGYPFGRVENRRHVIDRDSKTMRVTIDVDTGPIATFGPLSVEGTEKVSEKYVRRVCPWQDGQQYDRRLLDEYRQALIDTSLFASVTIATADSLDSDGGVAIQLGVEEREQRTIGSGLSWGTDEGFEVSAFWEHRNLFGKDENLRVETVVGEIRQSLSTLYSKPRFRRNDQTLLGVARVKREETDAYDETSLGVAVGLERRFTDLWFGRAGLSLELSDITENQDKRTLWIFGVPGALVRDSRDVEMDPTRGSRIWMGLSPYLTAGDDENGFVVLETNISAYKSLQREDRVILAGRVRAGSIVGESRAEIPASKRFYAGGGGSIRGYQFEKVGPLDDQNDPIGGRSVLELSGELRFRVTERFGLVPFVDGGTVFTNPDYTSEGGDTIRWSAGLGGRYYTVVGPIRLDIAFPINKRDVDDDYQFYISIGQAF